MLNNFVVVVESRGKADSIKSCLIKAGATNFKVISTNGRLKDLPSIDQAGNIKNKREIINKHKANEIKKTSSNFRNLFIATDFDTEGESIAQDVFSISEKGSYKRINLEFANEINIESLFRKIYKISQNDCKAQESKRKFDRELGFFISGEKNKKAKKSEVLGRVVSPTLYELSKNHHKTGIVVKKEKVGNDEVSIIIETSPINTASINGISDHIESFSDLEIEKTEQTNYIDSSTFWTGKQAMINISASLNISIQESFNHLQSLYESGLISYFRTDKSAIMPDNLEQLTNIASEFNIEKDSIEKIVLRSHANHKQREQSQGGHGGLLALSNHINPLVNYASLSIRDQVYLLVLRHSLKCLSSSKISEKKFSFNLSSNKNSEILRFLHKNNLNYKLISRTINKNRKELPYYPEYLPNGICKSLLRTSENTFALKIANDLSVALTMYKINVSRPSTFSYHSTNIATKYLDELGALNSNGINAISECHLKLPQLLKASTYHEIEKTFYLKDLSVLQRIDTALKIAGFSDVGEGESNQDMLDYGENINFDNNTGRDFNF